MPPTSQAQRRFMYAVAEGKVKGVDPSVGQEFEADDHATDLPEHVTAQRKHDAHPHLSRAMHRGVGGRGTATRRAGT